MNGFLRSRDEQSKESKSLAGFTVIAVDLAVVQSAIVDK